MSAFFVFIELLLGKLPWCELAKVKDKAAVLDMKNKVGCFTKWDCSNGLSIGLFTCISFGGHSSLPTFCYLSI